MSHGYTLIGGRIRIVDRPGAIFNQALGINDFNVTVGYSSPDPAGQVGQRAYSQANGTFTDINALLPNNVNSQAVGINNNGSIVGFYMPDANTSLGFLDQGGTVTRLDPFGSTNTQALGISNNGETVGIYVDANGVQKGFVDIGGKLTSLLLGTSTTINGVNDLGQITGFYTNFQGFTVGFVGSPLSPQVTPPTPMTRVPEPGSFALLGAGLVALAAGRRGRPYMRIGALSQSSGASIEMAGSALSIRLIAGQPLGDELDGF